MQNCHAITRKLETLLERAQCKSVILVESADRWNPYAAVVLKDVALPFGVCPDSIDFRIPLPELYGFATSAMAVLLAQPLKIDKKIVPFCRRFGVREQNLYSRYYVDFRERQLWPADPYYLCHTLVPDGTVVYKHYPLRVLVESILHYLQDPFGSIREEVSRLKEDYAKDSRAETLIRLGYCQWALGNMDECRKTYSLGIRSSGVNAKAKFEGALAELENLPIE